MNLLEAQRKAIEENAADSAEFDLVANGRRSRCRFEDADMGIFKVLDRPAHLVGKLLLVSELARDDGFTVENFTVPKQLPSNFKFECFHCSREVWLSSAQNIVGVGEIVCWIVCADCSKEGKTLPAIRPVE